MGNYQKILSGVPYYFGVRKGPAGTVRYTVKMKDEVDGAALEKAVQTAFKRYPYLKKSLVRHGLDRRIVDNPAPIAVLHTSEHVTLNSPEVNNHLIAISWYGNYIYFNNSHGMMDGRGRTNILKTLLYYYCKERYGEDIEMENVFLEDSRIDPAEYEEPFETPDLKRTEKIKLPSDLLPLNKKHTLSLSKASGLKKNDYLKMTLLRFDEKSFMQLCKSSDATPNTAVSLVFMRALDKMFPDGKKIPVASVCVDTRKAFGKPKTHLSTTLFGKLAFERAMRGKSFAEQNTILRGQLMLTADPDSQKRIGRLYSIVFKTTRAMRIVALKDFFIKSIVGATSASYSFMVSYAGKVSYGDCDKHIHGLVSAPYVSEAEIMMELTVADGYFYVSWFQMWDDDIYLDAYVKELSELGVPAEILATEKIDGPKLLVP